MLDAGVINVAFIRGGATSDASCLVGLTSKTRCDTGDDSVLSTRELQPVSGTHRRVGVDSVCRGGLGAAARCVDHVASVGIQAQ